MADSPVIRMEDLGGVSGLSYNSTSTRFNGSSIAPAPAYPTLLKSLSISTQSQDHANGHHYKPATQNSLAQRGFGIPEDSTTIGKHTSNSGLTPVDEVAASLMESYRKCRWHPSLQPGTDIPAPSYTALLRAVMLPWRDSPSPANTLRCRTLRADAVAKVFEFKVEQHDAVAKVLEFKVDQHGQP
eukprot:gene10374-8314_t